MTPDQQILALERRFKAAFLRLPLLAGNEAVNFTLDNFRMQGFLGHVFQPWPARKKGWRKKARNGSILVFTGALRRSIRITGLTATSARIGTDIKYARAHNEGMQLGIIQSVKGFSRKGGVQVKPHTRRINQRIRRRQFMGSSPYLNARIRRVITSEIIREIPLIKP